MKYVYLMSIMGLLLFSGCGEKKYPEIMELQPLPEIKQETESSKEDNTSLDSISTDALFQETESMEPEENKVLITISAAGDVSLGNYHLQDYAYSFRQTYDQTEDKSYFLENVSDIFAEDDFTIVNLEGVLTLSETLKEDRTYNIKGDPEYVNILTLGGVEAVSFANNHRWDYGEEGVRDTVATLKDAGIIYAYEGISGIFETKGIQIGFVSVNESSQGTAVEGILEKEIAELKEEDVDLILTCCHWGTEQENYPEDYQRELGKKCIDWGADLVLGHHPHVLQGVEEYQGKYIVHSLANFCFGANRNPKDKDTMIFQQTFTFVDGQKQDTRDIKVIPCSVSSISSRNDYRPTPAEGEEALRIIRRINEYSMDFGVSFTEEGTLSE